MTRALTPDDIGDLTPQSVSDLLRQVDASGLRRVSHVSAEWIETGGSFAGRVARVAVRHEGAAAPLRLIAKFAAANPAVRRLLARFGGYANEILFYRRLAGRSPIRVPRFFGARLAEDRASFLLLLEDCAEARVGDQEIGATAEEARSVLAALAGFHHAWWNRLDQPVFAELQRPGEGLDMATLFRHAWPAFEKRFGDFLPARLRDRGADAAPAAGELARRLALAPRTLLHGDLRLDNLLFAGDVAHPEPIFIDWQALAPGRGPLDVAYFCAGSLSHHDIGDISDLVGLYHGALAVIDYDWNACWSDFRIAVAWLWARTVTSGAFLDFDEPAAHARFRLALQRWLELAEACDAYEFLCV
jgi:Ecdysteroid kinase-like family